MRVIRPYVVQLGGDVVGPSNNNLVDKWQGKELDGFASPGDGESPIYNATSGKWELGTAGGGTLAGDVTGPSSATLVEAWRGKALDPSMGTLSGPPDGGKVPIYDAFTDSWVPGFVTVPSSPCDPSYISGSFIDNTTTQVDLASRNQFSLVEGEMTIFEIDGKATAYRFLMSGSASAGIGADVQVRDSGTPVRVTVVALYNGFNYALELRGSGVGATAEYRICYKALEGPPPS